jgi:hypothetical protein
MESIMPVKTEHDSARAAECRRRAKEAIRQADETEITRLREEYLSLAIQWLHLAEELDGFQTVR